MKLQVSQETLARWRERGLIPGGTPVAIAKDELARLRESRYRAALKAIAYAEIPGVSGGPNGASREVMEFARRALRGPCETCNMDSDGTPIYPDGEGDVRKAIG